MKYGMKCTFSLAMVSLCLTACTSFLEDGLKDGFSVPEKNYKEQLRDIRSGPFYCTPFSKPYSGGNSIFDEFLALNNLPDSTIYLGECRVMRIFLYQDMDSLIIPPSMSKLTYRIWGINGPPYAHLDSNAIKPRIKHLIGFEHLHSAVGISFNRLAIDHIPLGIFELDSIYSIEMRNNHIQSINIPEKTLLQVEKSLGNIDLYGNQITHFFSEPLVIPDLSYSLLSNAICTLSAEDLEIIKENAKQTKQRINFQPQMCNGEPKYLEDYE
jgi:hypothetical protein